MRAISENRFWSEFEPIDNPNPNEPENYQWEFADTLKYPVEQVWTLIEGEIDYRILYAAPGYHIVNMLAYCVTKKPWSDPARDAIYCGR